MEKNRIEEELKKVLKKDFSSLLTIDANQYFNDHNLLTSFETLNLVLLLEEHFKIKIDDEEFTEKNLGSFSLLVHFIHQKLQ